MDLSHSKRAVENIRPGFPSTLEFTQAVDFRHFESVCPWLSASPGTRAQDTNSHLEQIPTTTSSARIDTNTREESAKLCHKESPEIGGELPGALAPLCHR